MNIDKQDWDALNQCVAVAETAINLGKISLEPAQIKKVWDARELLTRAIIRKPGSYLPSRHPNRVN